MTKNASFNSLNQNQPDDVLSISGALKLENGSTFQLQTQTVALAGSSSGTAAALGAGFNYLTGADGAKGARLPVPSGNPNGGDFVLIKNGVNNVAKLYPHSGGKIDDGSTDASVNIGSSNGTIFVSLDATNWYKIPTTPS